MIPDLLSSLFSYDEKTFIHQLTEISETNADAAVLGVLRNAILRARKSALWYQGLFNRWHNLERPALKPNPVGQRLLILSNYTTDQYMPLVPLFAAATGIQLDIEIGPYDSVETMALNPNSAVYSSEWDYVVLLLSEQWLCKTLGNGSLVDRNDIGKCIDLLSGIVEAINEKTNATVLISNFPQSFVSRPGSQSASGSFVGWNLALSELNQRLTEIQDLRAFVIDVAEAIHAAKLSNNVGPPQFDSGCRKVLETHVTVIGEK